LGPSLRQMTTVYVLPQGARLRKAFSVGAPTNPRIRGRLPL
jgi:hypothetical protein